MASAWSRLLRARPSPGSSTPSVRPAKRPRGWAAALLTAAWMAGCDSPSSGEQTPTVAPPPPSAPPTAAPAAPPARPAPPEIIIDRASAAIGADRVATGDTPFTDEVAAALASKGGVEGQSVDVVAMRNAKPSQVVAVAAAVRNAKASQVVIKTSARDDSTRKLPLTFGPDVPDCTVVAWIGKDGSIDVWPAGGGAARRVKRGLAGPDMTLGMDQVRTQWAGCNSPAIVAGADDAMSWGLVFDLAQTALTSPGSRASAVALVTSATPGKKITLP